MDLSLVRKEFPIMSRNVHGKPLAYLDNASTTQKPRVVLDTLMRYYETMNANIHRGIHALSEESTQAYEEARAKVAHFINAHSAEEIIFTKNCTEAINIVAYSWADAHIQEGDEILVSAFEHHANLVPWQELVRKKGAVLSIIPRTDDLLFDMSAYEQMLSSKTKLVCVTALSNVTGTRIPLGAVIERAHKVGAKVLVDAAQSVGHEKTNVGKLDCDFLAFSAHKMMGPTGVGVLYVRREISEHMRPFLLGGDMVTVVHQHDAQYRESPWKFEAGTPNIADVIAYGAAIDFLLSLDLDAVAAHDRMLRTYALDLLSALSEITLHTPIGADDAGGVISFSVDGVHPHDVATVLDQEGIAIRSGLHCAEPLVRSLGIPATARMSFYVYNTREDIDRACVGLEKVFQIFKIRSRSAA
jgi:cysteine desulfurase / selenocysteine lyase